MTQCSSNESSNVSVERIATEIQNDDLTRHISVVKDSNLCISTSPLEYTNIYSHNLFGRKIVGIAHTFKQIVDRSS